MFLNWMCLWLLIRPIDKTTGIMNRSSADWSDVDRWDARPGVYMRVLMKTDERKSMRPIDECMHAWINTDIRRFYLISEYFSK